MPTRKQAEAGGFSSYSLPQIFGLDAMGVLAVVGREVPRIELATGVVPTYSRHPVTMAQQALTVQAASGGRFALGIGLSHQIVIEQMFGLSFEKPLRHMREYLVDPAAAAATTRTVAFSGETMSMQGNLGVTDVPAPPVLDRRARAEDARTRGHRRRRHRDVDDGPEHARDAHRADDHGRGRTRRPARAARSP